MLRPSLGGNIAEAELLIGYAFGDKSNQQMAKKITDLLTTTTHPLKLALQWEIADYLPTLRKEVVVRTHHLSTPSKKVYLDTEEVSRQIAEVCIPQGLQKVVIIAHPDHLQRCIWNAEKHGFKVVCVIPMNDIPYQTNWFKKEGPIRFLTREFFIARPYYFLKKYI